MDTKEECEKMLISLTRDQCAVWPFGEELKNAIQAAFELTESRAMRFRIDLLPDGGGKLWRVFDNSARIKDRIINFVTKAPYGAKLYKINAQFQKTGSVTMRRLLDELTDEGRLSYEIEKMDFGRPTKVYRIPGQIKENNDEN